MAKNRSLIHVTLASTLLAALFTALAPVERAVASTIGHCQETQLDVKITSDGAAAGHIGSLIVIVNVGARACTVVGYPTVGLSSSVSVVSTVARKTKNGYLGGVGPDIPIPVVTLRAHGGTASSIVEGGDNPIGDAVECVIYSKMSVTLPRLSPAYRFNTKFPGCIRPEVHPFVRGSTGLPYK